MRISIETYVVARAALAEMMRANPFEMKYRKAHEALRRAFEQENEREANQDQLPSVVRLQAG